MAGSSTTNQSSHWSPLFYIELWNVPSTSVLVNTILSGLCSIEGVLKISAVDLQFVTALLH